jgi:hypothetical protein
MIAMKFSVKKPHISWRSVILAWFRLARKFFVVLFFVVIGAGAFVWYEDVYHGEWTAEEKQAYAKTAFQETVFNEVEFKKSVMAAGKRAALYAEDIPIRKDLFAPIPGMEK